ncbi:hypothetical protein C0J52_18627 [Blattella germanica]|nr:hypothetical protein C0J52_18627 [Blattella germanica]
MFYIFKVKLVYEWNKCSAFCLMANLSGIMIFRILSCFLVHHQRLITNILISVLERNLGYDRLYTVTQILSGEIRDTPKDIAPKTHSTA